ncbi:hypothetical protein NKH54_12340 [Mesorhizobium sp. M1004]|uniref:hypothetical protein n=1 Tax=Mesorhizobium sp. M1004 TaxID=2957046 RepID=UPI00333B07C3
MQILSIRPEPPGAGSVVARFDLELSDQLRMFGLRLVKKPDGHRAIYAPNSGGVRVVTFGATLVQEIANAAEAAIRGLLPHDRTEA